MKKIFGTTAAIEEIEDMSPEQKSSTGKSTVRMFLIIFIGSFLSSVIMSAPLSYFMMKSGDAGAFLNSGSADYEEMSTALIEWSNSHTDLYAVLSLFGTAGLILATLFFARKLERRSYASLGIFKKDAVWEYLLGIIIGIAMFTAVYGIMVISGNAEFLGLNSGFSIKFILAFFFAYLIQGMSEELLIRGYYFVGCVNQSGVFVSILFSSIAFSILHIGNNGFSIVGFLNIFLFGIFAALLFLRRGNIWCVAAMHSIWNFVQGQFFGFNVSGNASDVSIFKTQITEGGHLLSGGSFGPEGSLIVTAILVVCILIVLPLKNKKVIPPLPRYKGEFHSAV